MSLLFHVKEYGIVVKVSNYKLCPLVKTKDGDSVEKKLKFNLKSSSTRLLCHRLPKFLATAINLINHKTSRIPNLKNPQTSKVFIGSTFKQFEQPWKKMNFDIIWNWIFTYCCYLHVIYHVQTYVFTQYSTQKCVILVLLFVWNNIVIVSWTNIRRVILLLIVYECVQDMCVGIHAMVQV